MARRPTEDEAREARRIAHERAFEKLNAEHRFKSAEEEEAFLDSIPAVTPEGEQSFEGLTRARPRPLSEADTEIAKAVQEHLRALDDACRPGVFKPPKRTRQEEEQHRLAVAAAIRAGSDADASNLLCHALPGDVKEMERLLRPGQRRRSINRMAIVAPEMVAVQERLVLAEARAERAATARSKGTATARRVRNANRAAEDTSLRKRVRDTFRRVGSVSQAAKIHGITWRRAKKLLSDG